MDLCQVEGIDPLPAVEGLMVSGKAIPGNEVQACGFTINGTTSCKFMWLRGSDDNSMNIIQGASTPVYKVSEADVNAYVAVEVILRMTEAERVRL